MPDCCPAVPGSNLVSPQPTADCQSPGGLPPGMALACGLTSVRGNRGEYYENEPWFTKTYKEKKKRKTNHLDLDSIRVLNSVSLFLSHIRVL
jgi:hypothetical protein